MSLIVCAQDCCHQSDGYCELNQITSLSSNNQAKCGYYEKVVAKTKDSPRTGTSSIENMKGFR